jgi:hypothetical protein
MGQNIVEEKEKTKKRQINNKVFSAPPFLRNFSLHHKKQ